MQRQYELALERIQELEEKYMDLKAEHELTKDENTELNERVLDLTYELNREKEKLKSKDNDLDKIWAIVEWWKTK